MEIRIIIRLFFWNTEKLADLFQNPLFKATVEYRVSACIFMKNNAASGNIKVFSSNE